jgi:hypothetical protein
MLGSLKRFEIKMCVGPLSCNCQGEVAIRDVFVKGVEKKHRVKEPRLVTNL